MYLITYTFFIFSIFHVNSKPTRSQELAKLLVISFDGFRYDYFDRNFTPFLKELKLKGTHADYMRNVFITKTYPNHHSIATGFFAESHGVVDSSYFDEKRNVTVKHSSELYHYSNKILPIWTINEKYGKGRRSGSMMWPGGDYDYQGTIATFKKPWDYYAPWEGRVDELISWFKHPRTPINFGIMYVEEPDFHGHAIGINSARFNEILKKVDNITKYIHTKLKENSLNDVNVVYLSDHGMSTITIDRIINLTNYINSNDYTSIDTSTLSFIYPSNGKKLLIYNSLKKASEETKKFDVYLKENIPDKYHYSQNMRIPPILVVAKNGYGFEKLYNSFPWYEQFFNITIAKDSEFGAHGYDNNAMEMHPFFFGIGPAFVPKCKVEPFDNVNLVPLFCDILEIPCPQTNGTLGDLKKCLMKYR